MAPDSIPDSIPERRKPELFLPGTNYSRLMLITPSWAEDLQIPEEEPPSPGSPPPHGLLLRSAHYDTKISPPYAKHVPPGDSFLYDPITDGYINVKSLKRRQDSVAQSNYYLMPPTHNYDETPAARHPDPCYKTEALRPYDPRTPILAKRLPHEYIPTEPVNAHHPGDRRNSGRNYSAPTHDDRGKGRNYSAPTHDDGSNRPPPVFRRRE